jgi:hypothetical protein
MEEKKKNEGKKEDNKSQNIGIESKNQNGVKNKKQNEIQKEKQNGM